MSLHLRHAPEPIQVQAGGNTLQAEWMPHCRCSWRDTDHLCHDLDGAVSLSLEHIATIPEMWPTPAA
jgi:hypothetical protein